MKQANIPLAILLLSIPAASAGAEDVPQEVLDKAKTTVRYQGAGVEERAPTIGTAFFSFSVDCQPSDAAARAAINAPSDTLWEEIVDRVPVKADASEDFTEERGRFFSVANTSKPRKEFQIVAKMPTIDAGGGFVAGSSKILDTCAGNAEISVEDLGKLSPVVSATRILGVRVSGEEDLTWLENKVQSFNGDTRRATRAANAPRAVAGRVEAPVLAELERTRGVVTLGVPGFGVPPIAPPEEPPAVKAPKVQVIPGSINYSLPQDDLQEMLTKVQKTAREEAEAQLAGDASLLEFENPRPLGKVSAAAPFFGTQPGFAAEPGGKNKVPVTREFTLSFFAQALPADGEGANVEYPVKGQSVAEADYLILNIDVESHCIQSETPEIDAVAALSGIKSISNVPGLVEENPQEKELLEALRLFRKANGAAAASEKDRLEIGLPSAPFEQFPYEAFARDSNGRVTQFLDTCASQVVDAPASGSRFDLPPYFAATQHIELRSDKFASTWELATALQTLYGSADQDPVVSVDVTDPLAALTTATEQKLDRDVRQDALARGLVAEGPLKDLAETGYKWAFFQDLSRAGVRARVLSASPFGASAAAESAADSKADLSTEVVLDKDERPVVRMRRDYIYSWEVVSTNFLDPAYALTN